MMCKILKLQYQLSYVGRSLSTAV